MQPSASLDSIRPIGAIDSTYQDAKEAAPEQGSSRTNIDVARDRMVNQSVSRAAVVKDQELELVEITPAPQNDVEAGATPRKRLRVVAVMTALFATTFIAALNQTIVATAIPTISSQLHSASGYAWIGGAYLLANAAAGPIWVKLSDIWGRKPIILIVVAWYFLASILCAVSVDMKMLIIGRAFQGTGGGGLYTLVAITMSDLFSLRERSFYLGSVSIIWTVAGAVGPVLGGAFTQYLTWRFIFWINLPITGVAFILLLFFLDVHNPRTPIKTGLKAIDWFGSVSILGLMIMLLLGLDFGGVSFPWKSPTVIGLIIAGGCMGIFFFWSEKRLAKYPLIPLTIFRSKSNVACLLLAFFHDYIWLATEYYLPLYFQSALLASPLKSGTYLMPIVITESLTGLACGIFTHRTGLYLPLIHVGTVILLIGDALFTTFTATSSLTRIVAFQIIAGIGTGTLFTPPLLALQANVRQEDTATATSTMQFAKNLATCLSVVVGGVVFQQSMETHTSDFRNAGLGKNLTEILTDNAAAHVEVIKDIVDLDQRMAIQRAFSKSLNGIWIICAALAGATVICGAMIDAKVLSKTHVETRTGVEKQETEVAN